MAIVGSTPSGNGHDPNYGRTTTSNSTFNNPTANDLNETLALRDLERAKTAQNPAEKFRALNAALDKLEQDGYDVSDLRQLTLQAFQNGDTEALDIIGDQVTEDIDSGAIEDRIPEKQNNSDAGDDGCGCEGDKGEGTGEGEGAGEGEGEGAGEGPVLDPTANDLNETLALRDLERSKAAETPAEKFRALDDALDKLEQDGYDVSDLRQLAEDALKNGDTEALDDIGDQITEDVNAGTIEDRILEDE